MLFQQSFLFSLAITSIIDVNKIDKHNIKCLVHFAKKLIYFYITLLKTLRCTIIKVYRIYFTNIR